MWLSSTCQYTLEKGNWMVLATGQGCVELGLSPELLFRSKVERVQSWFVCQSDIRGYIMSSFSPCFTNKFWWLYNFFVFCTLAGFLLCTYCADFAVSKAFWIFVICLFDTKALPLSPLVQSDTTKFWAESVIFILNRYVPWLFRSTCYSLLHSLRILDCWCCARCIGDNRGQQSYVAKI